MICPFIIPDGDDWGGGTKGCFGKGEADKPLIGEAPCLGEACPFIGDAPCRGDADSPFMGDAP